MKYSLLDYLADGLECALNTVDRIISGPRYDPVSGEQINACVTYGKDGIANTPRGDALRGWRREHPVGGGDQRICAACGSIIGWRTSREYNGVVSHVACSMSYAEYAKHGPTIMREAQEKKKT